MPTPRPPRRSSVGMPPLPKKAVPPSPPPGPAPLASGLTEQAKKVYKLAMQKKAAPPPSVG